jgi:hypothetical protein
MAADGQVTGAVEPAFTAPVPFRLAARLFVVTDVDTRLWRTLNRVWWVQALGVLGLLLSSPPDRSTATIGLLLVAVVALLFTVTFRRLPRRARKAMRSVPRYRPALALTGFLLGAVTVLVLWWALADLVFPGTLAPLALALFGVVAAGIVLLLRRLFRRA